MASNNKLLQSGNVRKVAKPEGKSEIPTSLGWPKRLYHNDFPAGKRFETLAEQNKAKADEWVESPADLKKEKEKKKEKVAPAKLSKIDFSEKD